MIRWLFLFLLLAAPALAQQQVAVGWWDSTCSCYRNNLNTYPIPGATTTKPGTYTPLASTQTLTLTTSPQTLTVPTGATVATLTVQTGAAMYRDDGTTLNQTNGLTLQVGGPYTYSGSLSALNLILPSGVTGTTVAVAYYK